MTRMITTLRVFSAGATLLLSSAAFAQNAAVTAPFYRESYLLEAKRDYAGAMARVRDAKRAGGNAYFAAIRIGWLAYLAGDNEESIARYTEAVTAEPKAVEPRLGLTLPLMAAGKWRELERASRDALTIDAQNPTALARLAMAYYYLGNSADAATTYRKLVEQYPSVLDYQTGLGWSLLKLGRTADARALFDAVLAVSPDNVSAKQGMAYR